MTHSEADAAYYARAWQRAFELYDGTPDLDARDLDRFAVSAMLLGRMDDYFAIRERAYHQMLEGATSRRGGQGGALDRYPEDGAG